MRPIVLSLLPLFALAACSGSDEKDDTGSHTYAPSELVNDDEDATESCAVGVILTRTQEGTYPSEFEAGGKVEAWRSWAVEYVSNP